MKVITIKYECEWEEMEIVAPLDQFIETAKLWDWDVPSDETSKPFVIKDEFGDDFTLYDMDYNYTETIAWKNYSISDMPDDTETVDCAETWMTIIKESALSEKMYDTPFDEGEYKYFSNFMMYQSFIGATSDKDFRWFECAECGRMVCEQNPSNGWHVQFRWNKYDEQVCNKCVEKNLFENGLPDDNYDGLFFDENELADNDYHQVGSYFIRDEASMDNLKDRVDELRNNNKVIISYDSMAIGGLEGNVSLYIKEK